MRRSALVVLASAGALSFVAPARAEPGCDRAAPWNRLGDSARNYARPLPLALTVASAVPPLTLATTSGDHELRVYAQTTLGGSYRAEPVSYYAPFVVGAGALGAFVGGALGESCRVERPAAAVLQAMALGLAVTGLSKWAIGRGWPNAGMDPHAPDRLEHPENAHAFHPFHAGLGAFPSGHTLSMTAAAAAFRAATPELGVLSYVGYPLAIGVGFGMWYSDRHWASDVLSGALLGEAIGSSVGRSFAGDGAEHSSDARQAWVIPVQGGVVGVYAGVF